MRRNRSELPWNSRTESRARHFFSDILPDEAFDRVEEASDSTEELERREVLNRVLLDELGYKKHPPVKIERKYTKAYPSIESEYEKMRFEDVPPLTDEEIDEIVAHLEIHGQK